MTMTRYVPTWERHYDKWETEPDIWDTLEEESSNDKVTGDISIEEILELEEEQLELEESEFDL